MKFYDLVCHRNMFSEITQAVPEIAAIIQEAVERTKSFWLSVEKPKD